MKSLKLLWNFTLKIIQEFAGHSSLKQTMDYIRITDDELDMSQYFETLSEGPDNTIIPFRNEPDEIRKVNTKFLRREKPKTS